MIFDLQLATPGHSSWQQVATSGELRGRTRDGAWAERAGREGRGSGPLLYTRAGLRAYRGRASNDMGERESASAVAREVML